MGISCRVQRAVPVSARHDGVLNMPVGIASIKSSYPEENDLCYNQKLEDAWMKQQGYIEFDGHWIHPHDYARGLDDFESEKHAQR